MSTLTKEWLLKTIAELEEERDAVTGVVNEDAAMALAAMKLALASLEAEAVAWLLSGGGAKNNVSFDSGNAYADPLREVTPLYTAHPAPVSVPAAMEMDDDFDSAFEHGKAVGWNAYRAAMLQSFGNSEQLNSPVIPDGWVACSQRLPETDGNYWGWWSESKRQGPVWFIKSELQAQFQSSEITHWMPLPAAPQQEVK
ncbi:DUF551 domain-containing protein [Enterobacter sichuanensis]|uniref:DUF551 domain-containing protein n=1 Tax=Enterobacter sichuanensis TaxID=2071710 RepID=A0AAE4DVZ9_9ENTR|nr:DUF551 domain-containing protein [Enterobacter sichuanensis]MDR0175800.1 DUF551 domain-containing protein [Enterobacter sichuanensis]MDR9946205.1 DUF551 domain-containing protein [Enterobacter sichuanensis]